MVYRWAGVADTEADAELLLDLNIAILANALSVSREVPLRNTRVAAPPPPAGHWALGTNQVAALPRYGDNTSEWILPQT